MVDGRLELGPVRGDGNLVLDAGARLSGTGLVTGRVWAVNWAETGGSFACGTGTVACVEPGNGGLGTLTVDGPMLFDLGSALLLEAGRDGFGALGADLLQAQEISFLPGSAIQVTVAFDAPDAQPHHLLLATCAGGGCDFASAVFSLQGPGVLGYDNTALWLDLQAVAVPEPANWALLVVGMGLLKLRGRRRA